MRCTLLFLVQRRKVLPFHQNRMPKRHQRVTRAALVMMGVMKLLALVSTCNYNRRKRSLTQIPSSKA
jgi:hypothetical protein